MKKRTKGITVILVLSLLLATLIPAQVMAGSNLEPEFPKLKSGYTSWMKTNSGKGNTVIDDLAVGAVKSALSGGISGWGGLLVAAADVIAIMAKPGKLYYIIDTYHSFDNTGRYQKFYFKRFYKDKERTKFVSSIQSKVESGIRYSDVGDEVI